MTKWTVLVAILVTVAASQLSAQTATCDKCTKEVFQNHVLATCEQVSAGDEGQAGCSVVQTVTPYGVLEDCQFSGGACMTYSGCKDVNQNGICDKYEDNPCPMDGCPSPLVIADRQYRFSDASDPVTFDINADGVPDRLTWTAAGPGMKFLWLDLNRNGAVDNGAELFGNYTSKGASNGFIALAQWDSAPYDRQINPADPVWAHLRLWEDANHDGISQAEELSWLADSDITALGLEYDVTNKEDRAGNQLRFRAALWHGDRKDKYYDVYFTYVP